MWRNGKLVQEFYGGMSTSLAFLLAYQASFYGMGTHFAIAEAWFTNTAKLYCAFNNKRCF